MNKLSKNQKGFTAIEAVLIVVILVLIGVVGWLVYKNQHKTTAVKIATTSSNKPAATTHKSAVTPMVPFINVIQSDNSVIQEVPNKIAKTGDEVDILTALHNTCTNKSAANITVNTIVFNGNSNFTQEGNYAVINAGLCDPPGSTIAAIGSNGADNYLHKNSSGSWIYDASSTGMPVSCSKVDGLDYPSLILSTCYDSSTSATRAPRP